MNDFTHLGREADPGTLAAAHCSTAATAFALQAIEGEGFGDADVVTHLCRALETGIGITLATAEPCDRYYSALLDLQVHLRGHLQEFAA